MSVLYIENVNGEIKHYIVLMFGSINEPRGHCAKWNKPCIKRQHVFTSMWHLRKQIHRNCIE